MNNKILKLVFAFILLAALAVRLYNINYNSPFVDESTSILIGKLGVFQGDWWSYNAFNWMSGNPYINPALSGIAYVTGGLTASRVLSVIFGVLTVEVVFSLTVLLMNPNKMQSYVAGLLAASIVAFSPVSIFISRMATYDSKSFFFFFVSIAILAWTQHNDKNIGKWYFMAFIFLFLALLAKVIILIYLPFIVIYSFLQVRKDKTKRFFWLRYFIAPLFLIVGIYMLNKVYYMFAFAQLQVSKEKWEVLTILKRIYATINYELWIGFAGSILMLLAGQWKKLLVLLSAAFWILVSHIVTQRAIWTMDKQIFVTVVFLAIVSGIGLSYIYNLYSNRIVKAVLVCYFCVALSIFSYISYIKAQPYNSLWEDSTDTEQFMKSRVRLGERVLTEAGSPVILALYDSNLPTNTTTFDWFNYYKLDGLPAYRHAVRDGYFDWIQLIDERIPKDVPLEKIHNTVVENMDDNYKLVYSNSYGRIYKRAF